MPTHNHTNDSWFVGAGSFMNPGISIPQIPNHTYDSWFVDAVLSIALLFLSEDLRIGPPCGRPRAGKEARKSLSQLDSHGMQCQAQTYTLTVAITEEAE